VINNWIDNCLNVVASFLGDQDSALWQCTVLGFLNPRCCWHALCQTHCLPQSSLSLHLDYWSPQFSHTRFQCLICLQVHYSHLLWLDGVDSLDLVDIQYFSLSSREVLCGQHWQHRWYFQQFQRRGTIMLNVWLGRSHDLVSIWNVFYRCQLLDFRARFLLCSR